MAAATDTIKRQNMGIQEDGKGNKKQKKEKEVVMYYAEDFDLNRDAYLNPIHVGKKYRSVQIQTSRTNKSKLRIQFTRGPGYIPNNFGVDTNQFGKTYLTFCIPDEEEFQSMMRISKAAIEIAKENKSTWWPKGITDEQITDNFNTFIKEKNPKKDGSGFWPGQLKVSIPLNEETGEVKGCKILDDDGSVVSIHDLPGRRWEAIVIELSGIYFQGKYGWGLGPKSLVNVSLCEDLYRTKNENEDVGFLEKKPPRSIDESVLVCDPTESQLL